MFTPRIPEWVGSASFLTLSLGVAYVMWALASENRELKGEIAELRARSLILGAAMQPGDQLPIVSLADLAGRPATLTDLLPRGGVIGFLTTTCPFCKQTLPAWGRLARAYAAREVPFVGVSLDDAASTRAYARSMARTCGPSRRQRVSPSRIRLAMRGQSAWRCPLGCWVWLPRMAALLLASLYSAGPSGIAPVTPTCGRRRRSWSGAIVFVFMSPPAPPTK